MAVGGTTMDNFFLKKNSNLIKRALIDLRPERVQKKTVKLGKTRYTPVKLRKNE